MKELLLTQLRKYLFVGVFDSLPPFLSPLQKWILSRHVFFLVTNKTRNLQLPLVCKFYTLWRSAEQEGCGALVEVVVAVECKSPPKLPRNEGLEGGRAPECIICIIN